MGNVWQNASGKHYSKSDTVIRMLMVGLDGAGKTTILYKMKLGEVINVIPTLGFNVETIHYKETKFVTWDISAKEKIRRLWSRSHYYQDKDALVFVMDSNDRDRISECKDELWTFLEEDKLKDVVVLIMANKQDLPNAMSLAEVADKLELDKVQDRKIYVQGSSGYNGEGLFEGLSWIKETLTQK